MKWSKYHRLCFRIRTDELHNLISCELAIVSCELAIVYGSRMLRQAAQPDQPTTRLREWLEDAEVCAGGDRDERSLSVSKNSNGVTGYLPPDATSIHVSFEPSTLRFGPD